MQNPQKYFIVMLLSLLLFLMNSQIQNKKNIQLTHLLQSIKTHKQEYFRRPLSLAITPVYLNSVAYLSQLIPTFLSHYCQTLKRQQVNSLTADLILLFEDLMMKLKSTADKFQTRQIQSVIYKYSELVKLNDNGQNPKLNETNDGSPMANTHDMIQLKLRQQTDTFTPLENKIFYQQLREALEKKQEVLSICHSQTFEFADFLDAQIHDILTLKEGLIFKEEKYGQNVNSEELKKQVSNSLKQLWRKKIPEITRLVVQKIMKNLQKNKKLDTINTGVQTQDVQNVKIIQLNRKITHLQTQLKDERKSNQKLIVSCQQKELMIKKMEGQLQQMGEQYHKKQYEMQKSIKHLQESNRRQKQLYQKQKSRKILTEKEIHVNTFKTVKTLRQLQEQGEQKSQVQKNSDVAIQPNERSQMIRQTDQTINKSAKYLFSSNNKIEQKDIYLTSKTHKENTMVKSLLSQRINQAIMTQIFNQKSLSESKDKRQKNQTNISNKNTTPGQPKSKQKQNKRFNEKRQLLKINSNTSRNKIQNKVVLNKIKKIGKNNNIAEQFNTNNHQQKSNFSKKKQVRLPSIKRNKNITNKPQNRCNTIQSDEDQSGRKMTGRFFEGDTNRHEEPTFNQVCQQPSNITLKSTVSLIQNESQRKKIVKGQHQQSTKQQTERQSKPFSQFQKNHISFQNNILTERIKILKEIEKYQNTPYQYQVNQKQNQIISGIKIASPGLAINRRVMTQSLGKEEKDYQTESLKICPKLLMSLFPSQIQGEQSVLTLKNKLEQMIRKKDLCFKSYNSQSPILSNINKINQNFNYVKPNENSINHFEKNKKFRTFLKKSLTEGSDLEIINHPKMSCFNKQIQISQINSNIELTLVQQRGFSPNLQKVIPKKSSTKQKPVLFYTNMLFLDQQMAFNYQGAFSKKMNKITRKLKEEVQSFGSQLFKILQRLRMTDKNIYQKVCKQLRYPFSRGLRNFIRIQIVSGISAIVVNQCLQILATLHKKCGSSVTKCQHFRLFKLKLEELVVCHKKI